MIDLVFITYNRLDYTRRALSSVLADPNEEFSLTIWDNASTDGTVDFLRSGVHDPRIKDIVLSKSNVGQITAVNEVWGRSRAELLGKLDNDCLMTPGWTRILAMAHQDIPRLGIAACWHYLESDFDADRARHKIQKFGNHQLLRHPWTCGTGFLFKRSTFQELGPLVGTGTTNYQVKMARFGYINGYYYPFVLQEHMDDPKSKYCQVKDEATFQAAKEVSLVMQRSNVNGLEGLYRWRKEILENIMDDPWDVRHYVGLRDRLRRCKKRIRGVLKNF